jgi:putative hydrolases of HD superfamily
MDAGRLEQQIRFIVEIDGLKSIVRRSYLINGTRRENSAEHSWHLAMLALILVEHSSEAIDLLRVLKMVLVHDLVEIDAGDTYIYDETAGADKGARELRAADRIFGILPEEQARELHRLWEEFEAQESPEARFAAALDRLMPLLHNYCTQGRSWREHGVCSQQVLDRTQQIRDGSERLWELARWLISDAVEQGYLVGPDDRRQVSV